MEELLKRTWLSKVTEGGRVKIPKEIVKAYKMGKTDVLEWTIDVDGKISVGIKEMVLKGKVPILEEEIEKEKQREKKVKVEKVKDIDVNDTSGG